MKKIRARRNMIREITSADESINLPWFTELKTLVRKVIKEITRMEEAPRVPDLMSCRRSFGRRTTIARKKRISIRIGKKTCL